jgi:predicted DNA-binding transcriptional regulator AlpA
MAKKISPSDVNPDLMDSTAVRAFFGGIDTSTLYRGMHEGRYPRPFKVSSQAVRWVRSECEAVLAAMIAARDASVRVKEAA